MKLANVMRGMGLITVVCLATWSVGMAGNGRGPKGDGAGACLLGEQTFGDFRDVTGTVMTVGPYGRGISVDVGDGEIVDVYGIGPIRYWSDLDVVRPGVGDVITVSGRDVTFSDGTTKFIAYSVAIGDTTVVLRDETTGLPLWRTGHYGGERFQNRTCPYAADDVR